MKKQVTQLLNAARAQGFHVELTNGGHWRVIPQDKDKRIVIVPSSPSCARGLKNARSELRKAGVKV